MCPANHARPLLDALDVNITLWAWQPPGTAERHVHDSPGSFLRIVTADRHADDVHVILQCTLERCYDDVFRCVASAPEHAIGTKCDAGCNAGHAAFGTGDAGDVRSLAVAYVTRVIVRHRRIVPGIVVCAEKIKLSVVDKWTRGRGLRAGRRVGTHEAGRQADGQTDRWTGRTDGQPHTQTSLSEDMCLALIHALRHFGPGVSDTIITCWFQPTYSPDTGTMHCPCGN
jgi:hypothetical protein